MTFEHAREVGEPPEARTDGIHGGVGAGSGDTLTVRLVPQVADTVPLAAGLVPLGVEQARAQVGGLLVGADAQVGGLAEGDEVPAREQVEVVGERGEGHVDLGCASRRGGVGWSGVARREQSTLVGHLVSSLGYRAMPWPSQEGHPFQTGHSSAGTPSSTGMP